MKEGLYEGRKGRRKEEYFHPKAAATAEGREEGRERREGRKRRKEKGKEGKKEMKEGKEGRKVGRRKG